TLVPSVAALPVIFSIASNNDISYLLDYAEQLASEIGGGMKNETRQTTPNRNEPMTTYIKSYTSI
ncbi:MAG: hypothetical protein QXG81_05280, partial [Ignisphaera sp.]